MKKKKRLSLDLSIYNESDLLDTVEMLSNRFVIELSKKNNIMHLIVSSRFHDAVSGDFRELFIDNLNDQKIRNKVNVQVQKVRDLIVGKALFETGSFNNESEIFMKDKSNLDFVQDKNKIATLFKEKA